MRPSVLAPIVAKSGAAQSIGGLPVGTVGTGLYSGFTLSTGDEFNILSLVSSANPTGKYFTTRTYQGGGGCRAPNSGGLAIMYDVSPDHTGWQDANRGVPISTLSNSHQIVSGEGTGALRLLAVRQSTQEQTLLNTGVAGQIERCAMISAVGAYWWQAPAIIEFRISMPTGPHGQHPDYWGLSSEPPNGPGFTGNEYGWECGNSKTGAYQNAWNGGILTNTETDIANYRDGSWHTFTVILSATDYKYYVDGTLVKTAAVSPEGNGNKADHMLITHHILNAVYQSQTYIASEWDLAVLPNGINIDIEWFRVWRQNGNNHYAPITTVSDVLVTAGSALNLVLPSQAAIWGATGLTEYVTCVQNEVEEPGSSNTVSYAQFPTGISYNSGTRTLSGTMPAQSGALYVVVGIHGNGTTCIPLKFRICAAPVYKGPTSFYWVSGTPVSVDVYANWDAGRLFQAGANPKGLTVTGLPSGLSFSSSTGLITGTPSTSIAGTLTLTCTSSAGQTTTSTPAYLIADPTKGAAAPTLTGTPTLLGSWDFDQAVSIASSGGFIDSIQGVDSTSFTLTGVTSTRPALSTRAANGTKGIADFTAASSQVLKLVSNMGIGTNGATVVLVTEPKATNAAATYLGIEQASATATVNRLEMGTGTGTTGWSWRKCGATGGNFDANQGSANPASITLAIGRSGATGSTAGALNVNGQGTATFSGGSTNNPTATDTTLLGCRSVSGVQGNFANAYVWRVLVYSGSLTDTNAEEIAVWANTNYGTPNVA